MILGGGEETELVFLHLASLLHAEPDVDLAIKVCTNYLFGDHCHISNTTDFCLLTVYPTGGHSMELDRERKCKHLWEVLVTGQHGESHSCSL